MKAYSIALLSVCFLILILTCLTPARADWQVTYDCQGNSKGWRNEGGPIKSNGVSISSWGSCSAVGSVTPILKWKGNLLPPKKIYVSYAISAGAGAGYRSDWGGSASVTCNYGTAESKTDISDCPRSQGHKHVQSSTTLHKIQTLAIDNAGGAQEVRLPSVSFNVVANGAWWVEFNEWTNPVMSGGSGVYYRAEVTPVTFALGQTAYPTAGAKDSTSHKSDFKITPRSVYIDPFLQPQVGPFPKYAVTLNNYEGEGADNEAKILDKQTTADGITSGVMRSSNINAPYQDGTKIQIDDGSTFNLPSSWGGWFLEAENQDPNAEPPSFRYEQSTPLIFKLSGKGPITDHRVTFKVSKVVFRVWDSKTELHRDEECVDPEVLNEVATFSPATGVLGDAQGVYRTEMTVHKIAQPIASVTILAEDEDVFKPF